MALNLSFPQHLEQFADTLERVYKNMGKAQPEDQLKAPVARLLEDSGLLTRRVELRTEFQVREVKGRPDMGLLLDGVLSGYLELKAPGLGANPKKFDERSKAQFEKFRALPNLLYTDGLEWALYRSGERVGELLELGDVLERGKKGLKSDAPQKLSNLLQDYLSWQPITPRNPQALAEFLAPLCRMVRDDVTLALEQTDSALSEVAADWRKTLFPDADNARFADSYAQTLTYALLLARLSGAKVLDPEFAAKTLDSGHGLLAGALRILGNPDVRADLGAGLDVLIRCIEAVDPAVMTQKGRKQWGYGHDENYPLDANESEGLREDPWLYFYEDFLGAYDRKLRNDYGVYYTPTPVILCQIKLVESLLKGPFGKALGFAEEGVTVLDPAAGTGAYPLAVLSQGLANVETAYGPGMRAQYATQLAQNIHAFEFLVGPYAVAHLRITQKLLEEGGNLPKDGVHVYLTDTLENPDSLPLESAGMMYRRLSQEHARAQKVKKGTDVLVCIGNPPYDRQERSEADKANGVDLRGGWVRFGAQRQLSGETLGILKDFVEPAKVAGKGGHLRNLYNDYIYFWRWALWKVLEQKNRPGIVSFITASSYLRGPGFVGVRQHMRKVFDEIWVIDLEGDSLGARKTENVFAIRTPVAILVGVTYGKPNPEQVAKIHYTRVTGTREAKLEQLANTEDFSSFEWKDCFEDWQSPFVPKDAGDYFNYPAITNIFPWQHTGVKLHRSWPYAETKDTLEKVWSVFRVSDAKNRPILFVETRDRKVTRSYSSLDESLEMPPLSALDEQSPIPPIRRYAHRSFDRKWILADSRLGDFFKPVLWSTQSSEQVFITSLLTGILGNGPAATCTSLVPDLDHFRGSFGAKHIIPLYRDSSAQKPNVTRGLLEKLSSTLETDISAGNLFAYVYAILSSPTYVERFSEELTLPGPRIPITKNAALFARGVALGRELVGWHTFGERWGKAAKGKAQSTKAIPGTPDGYPESWSYDPTKRVLKVGEGEFAPVSPEMAAFSVSGLNILSSWLGYRMKERSGRKSSPLDDIRPERWTVDLSKELLELLWLLEVTLEQFPELARFQVEVLAGSVFQESELPKPFEEEREPSGEKKEAKISKKLEKKLKTYAPLEGFLKP